MSGTEGHKNEFCSGASALSVAACLHEGRAELLKHRQSTQQRNFRAEPLAEGLKQTLRYILLQSTMTMLISRKCNKYETV